MNTPAYNNLDDDTLRSQLGKTLLAVRKARYLSVDDVASSLNMMPCHIRLIETAQYDPYAQQGMFSDMVEKYSQFADVRPDEAMIPILGSESHHEQLTDSDASSRVPPFASAALVAGLMVLAVFLPMSEMASDAQTSYERIAFEPLLLEPAAGGMPGDDSALLNGSSATDPLASTEKPQFVALDAAPAVGVAQHDDDDLSDPFAAEATVAVNGDATVSSVNQANSSASTFNAEQEPASYPSTAASSDIEVPEVMSFIESLRLLADRS